jgi:mediator of RNA polymerase II transcription subunit 6
MNTQYLDITWLTTFGLGPNNVLEYFYTSPFYDPTSNNEMFRIQGIPSYTMIAALTNGKTVGLEYEVDNALSKDPHLFVIKKQNRNKNIVEVLEVFYCLDGIIFQSPYLLDVLRTRLSKISHRLQKSFDQISSNIEYSSAGGHSFVVKEDESELTEQLEKAVINGNTSQFTDFKLLFEDLRAAYL